MSSYFNDYSKNILKIQFISRILRTAPLKHMQSTLRHSLSHSVCQYLFYLYEYLWSSSTRKRYFKIFSEIGHRLREADLGFCNPLCNMKRTSKTRTQYFEVSGTFGRGENSDAVATSFFFLFYFLCIIQRNFSSLLWGNTVLSCLSTLYCLNKEQCLYIR